MVRSWIVVMMLTCSDLVFAGVPVTDRAQDLLFPRAPVQTTAAESYHRELQRLASLGKLDVDKPRLLQIRQICSRLIAQAILLKPAAAHWPWEVHLTSDPGVAAYSMSGGKLLVGSDFIDKYHLNDNELAVALAHEIGHVIAEHVREQISMAAGFEPRVPNRTVNVVDVINSMESDISVFLRLQPLSRLQEMEADDIGIELAARAGVYPAAIISFYTKLARQDGGRSIFDTHGPSSQRVEFIESMADYARPVYAASYKKNVPAYIFMPKYHVNTASRAASIR